MRSGFKRILVVISRGGRLVVRLAICRDGRAMCLAVVEDENCGLVLPRWIFLTAVHEKLSVEFNVQNFLIEGLKWGYNSIPDNSAPDHNVHFES